MKILTFDIGGANTKKLVLEGDEIRSTIYYFPMWKRKDELPSFLQGLKEDVDAVGITMTAELSDAFNSKKEGVEYIIRCSEEVFNTPLYLSLDRRLLRYEEVKDPLDLAAANWVASLYFLERKFSEGILLDVGSTTTDILPFRRGEVLSRKTDLERLEQQQLIYTGFLRTPVNAIVDRLPYKGKLIGISSEYFAIAADVYNVLGMLEDYSCETPDGRGKSREESMWRIARILCADLEEVGKEEVVAICEYVRKRQVEEISVALEETARSSGMDKTYICGVGKDLAREASDAAGLKYTDLSKVTEAYGNLPCLGLAQMVERKGNMSS